MESYEEQMRINEDIHGEARGAITRSRACREDQQHTHKTSLSDRLHRDAEDLVGPDLTVGPDQLEVVQRRQNAELVFVCCRTHMQTRLVQRGLSASSKIRL